MTSDAQRPTLARISLANLRNNFRSITSFVGPQSDVLAVVKADSYGHGSVECAKALRSEGCRWFGVALVEEALELRRAGIAEPILILGGIWPEQAAEVLSHDLTPVVFRIDAAEALSVAAENAGKVAPVHVKVDTGMGRLGVRWDELDTFANRLSALPGLKVEGLMSHFAVADDLAENDFTALQQSRFQAAVRLMESKGFSLRYRDIANSPGAVAHAESRSNLVRIGGILYGLGDDVLPSGIDKPELAPVMSLHSSIALLKRVPAGESLGYGRTFVTKRDSLIATVPIGYHDGFPRALSGNAEMLVRGRRVPVVGRVSMDWTILDVTDVEDVALDDAVVVIGRDGDEEIRASDLARVTKTISYEITCGIGSRVPRRYVQDAEI